MLKSYQEPLTAALNSNRAILSLADMLVVLSPVAKILDLNRYAQPIHIAFLLSFCLVFRPLAGHREFKAALDARLQQWGAEQCVGDVCLKLCTHLRVYTNYLNNYTTALSTIDKVTTT